MGVHHVRQPRVHAQVHDGGIQQHGTVGEVGAVRRGQDEVEVVVENLAHVLHSRGGGQFVANAVNHGREALRQLRVEVVDSRGDFGR